MRKPLALILLCSLPAACANASNADGTTSSAGGAAGQGASAQGGAGGAGSGGSAATASAPLVDTGQSSCYGSSGQAITCPATSGPTYGQDAQYDGLQPGYQDNGDGTVTDLRTSLMWQKDPGAKMSFAEATAGAASFDLAGYDDWRLPTIKELYSLILFSGLDPSGCPSEDQCNLVPFIDAEHFDFEYGDTGQGERLIDSQFASSTQYVSTTMQGDQTDFGVNFADGRIKGYGVTVHGADKLFFVLYVRGHNDYGVNDLVNNDNGVITDRATGLMWLQDDSGHFEVGDEADGALDWPQALGWCEGLSFAGYDDWRLPNAKELQSIVDYTRSPATSDSAALDPVFHATPIVDEGGNTNYASYWTSTTHATENGMGAAAAYIAFGEALGWMQALGSGYELLDVHGAGAQRSDPKTGDPADYPYGHGPQGDVVRIYNHARCVRGAGELGNPGSPGSGGSGSGGGAGAGGIGGAGGAPPDGPTPCTEQADCELPGACPPDAALGCSCDPVPPSGSACIPICETEADCPEPPPGLTFACSQQGRCVPE